MMMQFNFRRNTKTYFLRAVNKLSKISGNNPFLTDVLTKKSPDGVRIKSSAFNFSFSFPVLYHAVNKKFIKTSSPSNKQEYNLYIDLPEKHTIVVSSTKMGIG